MTPAKVAFGMCVVSSMNPLLTPGLLKRKNKKKPAIQFTKYLG